MTMTVTPPTPTGALHRAGFAGLAASAAFLTTGILSTGVALVAPADAADMTRYLTDVRADEAALVLYSLVGFALCALYVPMSRGVTRILSSTRAARRGTTAVIAGLVALLPAYVGNLVTTTGLRVTDDAWSTAPSRLLAVHDGVDILIGLSFAVGSLLSLGIGPLLWGLSARSQGSLPTWLTHLLVLVGLTGLFWTIPPVVAPIAVMTIINLLTALAAFTALSMRMIRTTDG